RMSGSFSPRAVLGAVLFGTATFIALLYFIGQGDTGPGGGSGSGHARSQGLDGYAGLAAMLQKQGYDVTLSRSPGKLTGESLLVLTPTQWSDPDDIA
ncbi:DUF4350 domain-containing protein, partial [Klebsiella pneumoniae]